VAFQKAVADLQPFAINRATDGTTQNEC